MPSPERSFSDVLQDIVANLQGIIRSEVKLAKSELREEVRQAQSGGIWLGIGTLSGLFAVLFLLLAALYALSRVVPDWAAALILTGALGLIAAIALVLGIKHLRELKRIMPKTVDSIKENVQWAKQQIK